MTLNTTIDRFAEAAADATMRAGVDWVCSNRSELVPQMVADDGFAGQLRSALRCSLGAAMADAREALDIGMTNVAETTFFASMKLAGIQGAKLWAETR